MQEPLIPTDESERVVELCELQILDSAAEERFDRYTRLVKRLFDVPIALVSLVDSNRQWFKSSVGLEATQTPRNISFCGHAINHDSLFIVEDASLDPRFANNPLVTGDPHIRFYAGYPLQGPNGYRVGTLCIIDRIPRVLDEHDKEAFSDIGEMAASELASLQLASTDTLTGLSNRRGFEMLGEQALAICAHADKPASVAMIDMDGLKQINDKHGHAAGDSAIKEFGAVLLHTFRESDVVARLGGDEFCVLLTGASKAEAEIALARLSEAVADHNRTMDIGFPLAFSGGIAECAVERPGALAEGLHQADELMYHQKRNKPNRVAPSV